MLPSSHITKSMSLNSQMIPTNENNNVIIQPDTNSQCKGEYYHSSQMKTSMLSSSQMITSVCSSSQMINSNEKENFIIRPDLNSNVIITQLALNFCCTAARGIFLLHIVLFQFFRILSFRFTCKIRGFA
jgi:hypothetical protein